mmetsp:Transcript_629/g.2339  ORF Transcript_629/g.2339 Transcript_629/m.2339 type:complete len:274 (-) Transcript_629:5033-5854(-)
MQKRSTTSAPNIVLCKELRILLIPRDELLAPHGEPFHAEDHEGFPPELLGAQAPQETRDMARIQLRVAKKDLVVLRGIWRTQLDHQSGDAVPTQVLDAVDNEKGGFPESIRQGRDVDGALSVSPLGSRTLEVSLFTENVHNTLHGNSHKERWRSPEVVMGPLVQIHARPERRRNALVYGHRLKRRDSAKSQEQARHQAGELSLQGRITSVLITSGVGLLGQAHFIVHELLDALGHSEEPQDLFCAQHLQVWILPHISLDLLMPFAQCCSRIAE